MKRKPKTKNLALDEMRMMRENRKALLGHRCAPHEHMSSLCKECDAIFERGLKSSQVIACKHPGPVQEFKPHDCDTQWQTHIAYVLFMILTGLVCFAWGYGPKWLN